MQNLYALRGRKFRLLTLIHCGVRRLAQESLALLEEALRSLAKRPFDVTFQFSDLCPFE